MKIKKISQETTYYQKSEEHTFEINGKTVRVYYNVKDDQMFSNFEVDQDIDEKDAEKLTEIEFEALGEYLQEVLDTKVGEEFDLGKEYDEANVEAVKEAEHNEEVKQSINEAKHG